MPQHSPSACSAPPPLSRLVVFNRVPKCGSTSLENIIRQHLHSLSPRRRYVFVRSTEYATHRLNDSALKALASNLWTRLARRQPTLYDRHLIYVDFASLGWPQPVYINLLRHPVQMQLSTFYFWRECACSTQQAFCARARRPIAVASRPITVASRSNTVASRSNTVASRSNTVASPAQLCRPGYTIDDLYSNSSSPPSAARAGLLTRWFCGHDRACAKAGGPQPRAAVEATLRRAVHTLEHRYAWVGVLEQLEDSLRLLVHLLPAYFGQLAVERAAREHARPRSTSSRYTYAQPSEATRRLIEAESETDMRLYAHAVGLLHARLRRCGLRPATPRLDLVASGARS